MTYTPSIPASLLFGAVPRDRTQLLREDHVRGHFWLVNAQLTQVSGPSLPHHPNA